MINIETKEDRLLYIDSVTAFDRLREQQLYDMFRRMLNNSNDISEVWLPELSKRDACIGITIRELDKVKNEQNAQYRISMFTDYDNGPILNDYLIDEDNFVPCIIDLLKEIIEEVDFRMPTTARDWKKWKEKMNAKSKHIADIVYEIDSKNDIKGFTSGDWIGVMDNKGFITRIIVYFRDVRFIYDVTLSSRKSSDCVKFMEDLMMTYITNIESFIPFERMCTDAKYRVTYKIEENVDTQYMSVMLTTEGWENLSIVKDSKMHEWTKGPTQKGIIEGFKELLSLASGEIDSKNDIVNHPGHYETGKFECIEVMQEALGIDAVEDFCICNAFKYLYRHKRKNGLEDVKKAKWYIDKFLDLCSDSEEGIKAVGDMIEKAEEE